MWKTSEGSTGRLIQLCAGYFFFYVITGIAVKYFLGKSADGFFGMNDMGYLMYSTLGGTAICLAVAVARGWYNLKSIRMTRVAGVEMPSEFLYIIPSGICTAIVIPTTTLMYTLPISVMIAMVIMRASVIVIGRAVDAVQIRQGILDKTVYWEENIAVVLAVVAASISIFGKHAGGFDFLKSGPAVLIFSSYIVAYAIRIYIMNYYKNTRPKGEPLDNKAFFAVEQIAASISMVAITAFVVASPHFFSWGMIPQIQNVRTAIFDPHPAWGWAVLSGTAFGMVAFFSVFLFMFKGRTATFTGLVNRLTSLVAGTTATLFTWWLFGSRFPSTNDWISLGFIFTAVYFLSRAEKKRTRELVAVRPIVTQAAA